MPNKISSMLKEKLLSFRKFTVRVIMNLEYLKSRRNSSKVETISKKAVLVIAEPSSTFDFSTVEVEDRMSKLLELIKRIKGLKEKFDSEVLIFASATMQEKGRDRSRYNTEWNDQTLHESWYYQALVEERIVEDIDNRTEQMGACIHPEGIFSIDRKPILNDSSFMDYRDLRPVSEKVGNYINSLANAYEISAIVLIDYRTSDFQIMDAESFSRVVPVIQLMPADPHSQEKTENGGNIKTVHSDAVGIEGTVDCLEKLEREFTKDPNVLIRGRQMALERRH